MATYRGDGQKRLGEALREPDPGRKLDGLTEAMLLHFNEMEYCLGHLGPENFSEGCLDALAERVADKIAVRMTRGAK
jgi:hypothetical protein